MRLGVGTYFTWGGFTIREGQGPVEIRARWWPTRYVWYHFCIGLYGHYISLIKHKQNCRLRRWHYCDPKEAAKHRNDPYECACGEQNKWRIKDNAMQCSKCNRRYDIQKIIFYPPDENIFEDQKAKKTKHGKELEKDGS